ncbi:hypothetical protein FOL47_011070 [Perkinsus chesapeaki]|uniref:Uncharacterized protein n=1 Tax=Perkinsus chesapeaki TaxID=330153 RepID=A0A7J6MQ25_PERCH|nr:hypothetical protein FOL47_011070 [Perkinsus chesapeaki]
MLALPSPPTRGTSLFPCIEEEEEEADYGCHDARDMVASLVDCLGQLDLCPEDSPKVDSVPLLSKSASTSAMLTVAGGRGDASVGEQRVGEVLPTVQDVKSLHKSVQIASVSHRLWPVPVDQQPPYSSVTMTPSPDSLSRHPCGPEGGAVTLGCPLCDLQITKADGHLYEHIYQQHHRDGILRVEMPDRPAYLLHACHRKQCWSLPSRPVRARRDSRASASKTPEGGGGGPTESPSSTACSVVVRESLSGGHYHCPLCGMLCVGDALGGGVRMHIIGCKSSGRRRLGPSMIRIQKVDRLCEGADHSQSVDTVVRLNAVAEDRTRDLRFHNEVQTREFPRVLSYLEQLDSPGIAHRPARKKYRRLYDIPELEEARVEDYVDALCLNALEGRGMDFIGARMTLIGSGVPPVIFRVVRGTGGEVWGVNYMEASQWKEMTHVLVGPMVHVGSLRNFCHTVRQLGMAVDKLVWVDCRDLITPSAAGPIAGWSPSSLIAAVTCAKRTIGSTGKTRKKLKGSGTPSPATSPDTKTVPSVKLTLPRLTEEPPRSSPLQLVSINSYIPAPQLAGSGSFVASPVTPVAAAERNGLAQSSGGRYSTCEFSPYSPATRDASPPDCDAPLIPGVTITPGKHRQRRRAVGGVRGRQKIAEETDGKSVKLMEADAAVPRRSMRLSRSAPPKRPTGYRFGPPSGGVST